MPRKRAFTIYELLAVAGILIALAGVLFFVYRSGNASEKKAQCLTNLRDIGNALSLYAASNDDTLPMAYRPTSAIHSIFATTVKGQTWADLVSPYVASNKVWTCPVDPDRPPMPGLPLSYALNDFLFRMPKGVRTFTQTGGSLSEMAYPGHKLMVVESYAREMCMTVRPDFATAFKRHLEEGSNFLYADGHAQYHVPPAAWRRTSSNVWEKPELAAKEPYPQWFPWLETANEGW